MSNNEFKDRLIFIHSFQIFIFIFVWAMFFTVAVPFVKNWWPHLILGIIYIILYVRTGFLMDKFK